MGASDRVKEYLDYKSINKYAFYKKTGLSKKFLDNCSNMCTNKAEKIIHHYLDINPGWLLNGEGIMLKDKSFSGVSKPQTKVKKDTPGPGSKSTEEIIAIYERLTERLQDDAERMVKELNEYCIKLVESEAEIGLLEIKYSEMEEKLRECEGRRSVGVRDGNINMRK